MPAKRETEWERRQRRERERAAHVAEHGPGCEICGAVPKRGGLHQDHNHRTGETRGWLCHRCNRALPTWVTVRWLLLATAYLAKDDPAHKVVESYDRPGVWLVTLDNS